MFSQNRLAAMDESKLYTLTMETTDYFEKIKATLNQFEEIAMNSEYCFSSESGNFYRNGFKNFFSKTITLESNIQSIIDDLIKARYEYGSFDDKMNQTIKKDVETLDLNEKFDFHMTINSKK